MVRSQLSIEDRKKRLQEIKSKSKCLKCGQIGHWSGDPVCPKGRGAGQASHNKPPPAAKPQAFMAEMSDSSEDDSPCIMIGHSSDCGELGYYMALKSGKGYSSPQKVSPARSCRGQIPPGGETIFECGQHQGLSYDEIVHRFPGYVVWGRTQKSPSLYLARFLDYCQNYYIIDRETMEVKGEMSLSTELHRHHWICRPLQCQPHQHTARLRRSHRTRHCPCHASSVLISHGRVRMPTTTSKRVVIVVKSQRRRR